MESCAIKKITNIVFVAVNASHQKQNWMAGLRVTLMLPMHRAYMMDASAVSVWHSLVLNDNVHVIIQIARKLHLQGAVHSQHCQCEACMHNRATVAQSISLYMTLCAGPESAQVKPTGVCTIQCTCLQ